MANNINLTGQDIYQRIKEDILTLKIRPGEKISENDLCEQFSVSRTPIRGVFQRLNAEGLITIEPYKTTFASLLDFSEVEQMIYMRYAIEAAVLKDFVSNFDPMAIEKMRYRLRQQEVLLLGNDFIAEQFYALDAKFHNVWFQYTSREPLWKHINNAQANYTRFRMLDIVIVKNFREIYNEHEDLFAAICSKDIATVESQIKNHVYGGMRRLGTTIKTKFADYFVEQKN